MRGKTILVLAGMLLLPGILAGQINLKIEKTVLDNGLTVLTCEDHSFPTVSYQTFINAGSRDELREGATGIAHVFEHMMFRGTPSRPDYDEAVAFMGPQVNAYTGQDYTCYYVNTKAEFLPQIVEIEADRLRNLRFTPDVFRRELGTIIEERRRFSDDDPDGFLEEKIYQLAYTRHTYRHPVIGWGQDLEKGMTWQDAEDFRQIFYAPNFTVIVVSGDFMTQDVLDLIQHFYGDWPSHLPPTGRIQQEPPQTRERSQSYTWKSSEIPAKIALAYHIPDHNFQDNQLLALQVMDHLLFSRTGRVYRNLKDSLTLIEDLRSSAEGMKDPGLFLLYIDLLNPLYRDSVINILDLEFARIAHEGIGADELGWAVNGLRAKFIYNLDRPGRIGSVIGYFHLTGGDYRLLFEYYQRLGAVTVEDIRGVAGKFMQKGNRSLVTLLAGAGEQEGAR